MGLPRFGELRLDAITNAEVAKLKTELVDRSPKTVNNVLVVLRVMVHAGAEHLQPALACQGIKYEPYGSRLEHHLQQVPRWGAEPFDARCPRAERGNLTVNVVPSASVERTSMRPPCARAICWTMKRPQLQAGRRMSVIRGPPEGLEDAREQVHRDGQAPVMDFHAYAVPLVAQHEVHGAVLGAGKVSDNSYGAMVAHGGTISHQHGVGTDHRPYLEAEKGALGLAAIRQVRSIPRACSTRARCLIKHVF